MGFVTQQGLFSLGFSFLICSDRSCLGGLLEPLQAYDFITPLASGPADCPLCFFSFKVLCLPALEAGTLPSDNRQGAGVHYLL